MKRAFLIAILAICAVASGFALDPEYINPRMGVMIINNVVAEGVSAPNAIVNTLGVALSLPFQKNSLFSFEPGLDVYWTQYEWGTDERAHPTELETASAAFVLGVILDAPVFINWQFGDSLGGMFGIGPAFVLRASFLASGANEDTPVGEIASWFYQKFRWFYPTAQFCLSYQLQPKFTFELVARGFLPLFNAWDSTASSFWDQAMLNIGMGMRVKL